MAVTVWALWVAIATDRAIPGWASIVLPMYFLGGVQLLALGVIGEYLGKLALRGNEIEATIFRGADHRRYERSRLSLGERAAISEPPTGR
jgi:hypothetical protein